MGISYSLGADKETLIFFMYMAINKAIVNTIFIFIAGLLFIGAVYIYINSRNGDMILYYWLGIDYNNCLFEYVRYPNILFTPWVRYNLPDGLWLLSFLLFIEGIWDSDRLMKWIFGLSVTIIAFVLEILQFVDLFSGTGDWLDILFYIIAILIFLLLIKLKQMYYEKDF